MTRGPVAELPRSSRRVVALINQAAGTSGKDRAASLQGELAAAFAERAVTAEIRCVEASQLRTEAERAAEAARAGALDAVVVGGGDGSIRAVAGVLAGTGIPLGILPMGTLNHFAKDLGIPTELDDAVALIGAADARAVDVAEVNGQVFINNSAIGLYPFMLMDRDRRRASHGLSKWPAMALAAVRALWQFPMRRLAIRAEGWTEPCRTPLLFVGNNAYEMSLPDVGTRKRLDGGEICLLVINRQSRLALLWLGIRAMFGLHVRARDLRTCNVTAAEIHARTTRLAVSADGEVEVIRPPLQYRIRPCALRVLAPPSGAK